MLISSEQFFLTNGSHVKLNEPNECNSICLTDLNGNVTGQQDAEVAMKIPCYDAEGTEIEDNENTRLLLDYEGITS